MAILIVDNYFTPSSIISKYIYRKDPLEIILKNNNYSLEGKIYSKIELYSLLSKDIVRYSSKLYSIHVEHVDDDIKYYFSEICSVKDNKMKNEIITVYNKNKDKIKYYEIIRNDMDKILDIRKIEEKREESEVKVEEKELPFLDVQKGEVVIFPSDEEE